MLPLHKYSRARKATAAQSMGTNWRPLCCQCLPGYVNGHKAVPVCQCLLECSTGKSALQGRQPYQASSNYLVMGGQDAYTGLPMCGALLCRQGGSAKAASASKPAATAWDWCHKFDLAQQTPLEETALQVRRDQRQSSLLASSYQHQAIESSQAQAAL